MNSAAIVSLVTYNFWADERILDACQRVSVADLVRPLSPDPGWGSLRGILVHALDTEWGWRLVLLGQDASALLDPSDFPDVETLRARWREEEAAWHAYAGSLSDVEINRVYGGDAGQGPRVWQTIVHVVNHGTQHRSEAAAILTGLGLSPGELDYDTFLKIGSSSA